LGPLTNLAHAINQCETALENFGNIVILGGAKHGGNRTPVAEFNIWQDPDAAAQVLSSSLQPTLIPYDTFRTFNITQDDLDELSMNGTAVTQLIFPAIQLYAAAQTGLGGNTAITVPDVPSVMYGLDTTLGVGQSALVKIIPTANRQFRGQTVIGLDISERLPMIADDQELSDFTERLLNDPNFDFAAEVGLILAREPDNSTVVMDIKELQMHMLFMKALTN
jgi:inosine-uridine nucleoside N-ribohydrolase